MSVFYAVYAIAGWLAVVIVFIIWLTAERVRKAERRLGGFPVEQKVGGFPVTMKK